MIRKKIQYIVLVVVLIAGGIVAWYLFEQSSRLKQNQHTEISQKDLSQEDKDKSELNRTTQKFRRSISMTEQEHTDLPEETSPKNKTEVNSSYTDVSFSDWVKHSIITPYFVNDLSKYIVSNYYPPRCEDNSNKNGTSKIDFKSINARYGLELIGLRHRSSSLDEAREEILQQVMRPKALEEVYDQYGDNFIQELIKVAQKSERKFINQEGEVQKRTLNNEEIAEMLKLNSDYLQDTALVFKALGEKKEVPRLVEDYLQAAEEATHINYLLNKLRHNYEQKLKKNNNRNQSDDTEEDKINQLSKKKKDLEQRYKETIIKREQLRRQLIDKVVSQTGPVDLEDYEILYMAEWVYRRLLEGENSSAILAASNVLADLANKFRQKAVSLQQKQE